MLLLPSWRSQGATSLIFSVLDRLFPSLLQHGIGLNQEERVALCSRRGSCSLTSPKRPFLWPLSITGLRIRADTSLKILTIRGSRFTLTHGDILLVYTDL